MDERSILNSIYFPLNTINTCTICLKPSTHWFLEFCKTCKKYYCADHLHPASDIIYCEACWEVFSSIYYMERFVEYCKNHANEDELGKVEEHWTQKILKKF